MIGRSPESKYTFFPDQNKSQPQVKEKTKSMIGCCSQIMENKNESLQNTLTGREHLARRHHAYTCSEG
jgi:hypothetical protein